jgi:hypothetical protein
VNGKINQLTYLLHKTADKLVPKKLIKLNGFKNKASSKVRQLIQTSNQKHREWDNADRPRNDHKLFLEKKAAKRALCRQQRKETAIVQCITGQFSKTEVAVLSDQVMLVACRNFNIFG